MKCSRSSLVPFHFIKLKLKREAQITTTTKSEADDLRLETKMLLIKERAAADLAMLEKETELKLNEC